MTYNLFDGVAPAMPKPKKGTEVVGFLLSKASKDMREVLFPMVMPAMAAHLTGVRFAYSDGNLYELCGQMSHLVAFSGTGKGQLTRLVEPVMRRFQEHDKDEFRRLADWQRTAQGRGKEKDRPQRPEVCFRCPPGNSTNAAFLQNAAALEQQGGLTQYINLPEVEMADSICGSHRQVSQMIRVIYDCQRAGALRATADGVTGNPVLRVNLTISSTPEAARQFYHKELTNGVFGRIAFAYKPRGARSGKIPKQGRYDEAFQAGLDRWLDLLSKANGDFRVKELNKVADELAEEMVQVADLIDDDIIFDLSHRSILSAWKKGAVLWLLNEQVWTRSIGEFVRWFCYHDLWSKLQVFGDLLNRADPKHGDGKKSGPQNMMDRLPDTFSQQQLEALRLELGKAKEGARHQLQVWKSRRFVTFSAETGLYAKTDKAQAVKKTRKTPRP